ncbi:MAG: NmrA family NAD(P)-binding protein [Gemmatimonadaceae bacterium]|nr:NmrA family NAD(P)-binding protein [Gemmatimonadaceae bacterium]
MIGDLLDPSTLGVFAGMDAVFLLNPVSTTETFEGIIGVNGARTAGVKRIVYLSVHDLDRAPHLPHFGGKIGVEAAVMKSGMEYTILRPNNFYQNDIWMKEAITSYGVYPQPIGNSGLSRVDVRDIAEAAVVALTSDGHDKKVYNLVGPDIVTGESTAAEWSRALGKPVKYAGDDLEAWEAQQRAYLPPSMLYDFKHMYAFFQTDGLKATPADIEKQTEVLGHPPRSFAAYAKEMAALWKS